MVKVIEEINRYSREGIPFLVIIDFLMEQPVVIRLDEINPDELLYDFNGRTNLTNEKDISLPDKIIFEKYPISMDEYSKGFNIVKNEIAYGNTYLINYTCATPIKTNLTTGQIFNLANAKYKLWVKGKFVCFSPEIFVKIIDGRIFSHPMKGTIDASLPDAQNIILNDKKEKAEHYTIVDLIRNDLNVVSHNVQVERFRYFDTVETNNKTLLQVSSVITGSLDEGYNANLGEIIFKLLPAGSVTGAPKKKTVEIIQSAENYQRGYYTGIAGIFDGRNFDSCVLIRFIEESSSGLTYKSGGGITSFSSCQAEYKEMIDKVYLPLKNKYTLHN